jgi:hypothetical protein
MPVLVLGNESPKSRRREDAEVLDDVRSMRCLVFGCRRPAEAAHVLSRGAGHDDSRDNVIPLCAVHHRVAHDSAHVLGWWSFCRKHPEVGTAIALRGWVFIYEFGVWKLRRREKNG